MNKSIVIGAGFGDEGKVLLTSYLVSHSIRPFVIRFNGGHQAGHTVVYNDKRHVFSNFGSGTLQYAPSYFSQYCTVHPSAILRERAALSKWFFDPLLYIDPLCMVTTPYDILFNGITERKNRHGSCGVGFGQTIKRNEDYYKLHAMDLKYPTILKEKLKAIESYYDSKLFKFERLNLNIDSFINECEQLLDHVEIDRPNFEGYTDLVFEGAQGILLDMDFGFFPNVTRSNTTSKNAISLIQSFGYSLENVEIYYASRVYQTRHGNGFMSNEGGLDLINNKDETNITNEYQGKFRTGALDVDLLNYAFEADNNFSKGLSKNILFTCFDQIQKTGGADFSIMKNSMIEKIKFEDLNQHLTPEFQQTLVSNGPESKDIGEYKFKLRFY
jgi:adenylosuccinate synthase